MRRGYLVTCSNHHQNWSNAIAETYGRIHSSAYPAKDTAGVKPEDWEGPPELTPPANQEDCTTVGNASCQSSKKPFFHPEDAYSLDF